VHDKDSEIWGIRKAAIRLLTMDEELSKEIKRSLKKLEIQSGGTGDKQLKSVPDNIVKHVHDEFVRGWKKQPPW
jgi:flagellar motor switch protein FliG